MRYFTRSATLNGYVETARALHLDPYQLVSDAGIDRAALLDPNLKIPAEALKRLLESSAAVAQAEDFGLRLAQSRHLSDFGPVGLIAREQPTLRRALDAVARHLRLHNEALSLHIEEADGIVTIHGNIVGGQVDSIRQSSELVIGASYRMLQTLFGTVWKPLKVCFSHAAPRNLSAHHRFFAVPVAFDSDFDGIVCRARDLDLPMPAADPQMAKYITRYIASLAGDSDADMGDRVRKLVAALLPAGNCSLVTVAHNLGVEPRTVQRHLRRRGETFGSVLDAVRAELAMRYVQNSKRSSTDIALMLGFSAPSAFSRWFSGHFGCSPSTWRARQALIPPPPVP